MANRSFNLSNYASVEVSAMVYAPACAINIHKSMYAREPVDIQLNRREWECLANYLPNIYHTARSMVNDVQAGKTVEIHQEPRKLSNRFLLTLSVFQAPNGKTYVTTGIRRYFINEEGVEVPKREGGVNLSFEELESLFAQLSAIGEEVLDVVRDFRMVHLHDSQSIVEVTRVAEEFLKSGKGNFRLVLTKPEVTSL